MVTLPWICGYPIPAGKSIKQYRPLHHPTTPHLTTTHQLPLATHSSSIDDAEIAHHPGNLAHVEAGLRAGVAEGLLVAD
jgi:hypothetical protein